MNSWQEEEKAVRKYATKRKNERGAIVRVSITRVEGGGIIVCTIPTQRMLLRGALGAVEAH